jgi:oligopeptide transport system ATP-binding protein
VADRLLELTDLRTEFRTDDGVVKAVNGVSFHVDRGEALGIVGESGSGKSVTNMSMLGLIPQPPGKIVSGQAIFDGKDLLALSRTERRNIRGNRVSMIFQDPMTSLNPFLTIGRQMTEALMHHKGATKEQAENRAVEMLDLVGIPAARERLYQYPHQYSGGMRQRVMIAMALMCGPDLLIADEPTTALDVTIQAQILGLLRNLQKQLGMALILITHNLGAVAGLCSRVVVMYGGRIVEQAPVTDLFHTPRHPYTAGLLKSIPRLDEAAGEKLVPIAGNPPDLTNPPPGCAFAPRCPFRTDACEKEVPALVEVAGDGRLSACIREGEIPDMKAAAPEIGGGVPA